MHVTDKMVDAFLDYWAQPGWRKFSPTTKAAFRQRARNALIAALRAVE